jgi:hypothetical protein
MSDERRKTAVQSGTEDIKRFLSHFSDNALTPPAPVRSDARAKDEAYAMGQRHGEMAATARWARFAPDVPHSAIGPSKITNKAGLVVPSNELSEARHGLAFQGGAPMHIQAPQGAGAPLPAPAVATYPGHGAEAQTRASGMPADWAPWLDAGPPMQDPNIPAQVMPPVLPDDELRRQAALQGQPVASDRQLKAYVKPADRSIKDFLTQVYAHARV